MLLDVQLFVYLDSRVHQQWLFVLFHALPTVKFYTPSISLLTADCDHQVPTSLVVWAACRSSSSFKSQILLTVSHTDS